MRLINSGKTVARIVDSDIFVEVVKLMKVRTWVSVMARHGTLALEQSFLTRRAIFLLTDSNKEESGLKAWPI